MRFISRIKKKPTPKLIRLVVDMVSEAEKDDYRFCIDIPEDCKVKIVEFSGEIKMYNKERIILSVTKPQAGYTAHYKYIYEDGTTEVNIKRSFNG